MNAPLAIVTVPFFVSAQHRLWAEQAIASLSDWQKYDRIAIVNRVRPVGDDLHWLKQQFSLVQENDQNILARAWNTGLRLAFARGAEYALVINTDLIFHPECISRLIAFAQNHPEACVWSAFRWHTQRTMPHAELTNESYHQINWSCFLVHRSMPDRLGWFDEQFVPAYHEDGDMRRRMQLMGMRELACTGALFYHVEGGTLRGCVDATPAELPDPQKLISDIREAIIRNDQRYVEKWGGMPNEEKFELPYNGVQR